jgi:hypothetical protein
LAIKPNIAYNVILLTRFIFNLNTEYIITIKKVLKYLKETRYLGITYSYNNNLNIIGYYNIDYIGDIANIKSTSGYIFYIANALFI